MELTIEKFGGILKNLSMTAKISYGSGGYCVILCSRDGEQFAGYSWDLNDAILKAVQKIEENNSYDRKTISDK